MPARRYPDELRQRAVRMVFDIREQTGEHTGVIGRVAASWESAPRACGAGYAKPKSTAASAPA